MTIARAALSSAASFDAVRDDRRTGGSVGVVVEPKFTGLEGVDIETQRVREAVGER